MGVHVALPAKKKLALFLRLYFLSILILGHPHPLKLTGGEEQLPNTQQHTVISVEKVLDYRLHGISSGTVILSPDLIFLLFIKFSTCYPGIGLESMQSEIDTPKSSKWLSLFSCSWHNWIQRSQFLLGKDDFFLSKVRSFGYFECWILNMKTLMKTFWKNGTE